MPISKRWGLRHAANLQHGTDPTMTLWDAIARCFGKTGADYWVERVDASYRERFQTVLAMNTDDEFVVINLILWCPFCGAQHIDAPEPSIGWTNPPHRSHKCSECDCIWRPGDMNTNGVERINTVGKDDWIMLGTTAHIFTSEPRQTRRR